jgi:hypothetical protein
MTDSNRRHSACKADAATAELIALKGGRYSHSHVQKVINREPRPPTPPARFELATQRLTVVCTTAVLQRNEEKESSWTEPQDHFSRANDGDRTRDTNLEGWDVTATPHSQ